MEIFQHIHNGLIYGTILAVPANGLTAIFAVLRFTNFALASHMTIGAFAGFVVNVTFAWPVVPSLIVAFVVAGLVVLGQTLGPWQIAGLVLITAGNVIAVGRTTPAAAPPAPLRAGEARALG